MKKEKKGKDSKSSSCFVELKSISDLARNVSTFGEGVKSIFALKKENSFKLFTTGIKLNEVKLVFYFDTKKTKIGSCLTYRPKMATENEIVEIKESMLNLMQSRDIQNIPIIELATDPFEKTDGKPKAHCVCVKEYTSLIRGVISKSIENESIGKVYSFIYKSNQYIGSFALMDEEDTKIFCYSKLDSKKEFGFFRYNYQTDKVEETDVFGEHSYLYVRVINIAEAFSFFKPE